MATTAYLVVVLDTTTSPPTALGCAIWSRTDEWLGTGRAQATLIECSGDDFGEAVDRVQYQIDHMPRYAWVRPLMERPRLPPVDWRDVIPCSAVPPSVPSRLRADGQHVDIGHPQGMAYALRQLFLGPAGRRAKLLVLIHRWAQNETTDADRLEVARALAEVAP